MGSWNKTCGLSNLHIYSGSPVYVFTLVETSDKTDRCYATSFWKPVLLPFTSVYNDYGGGEQSCDNINYILEGLKKNLVEKEQGDNEYHDIPVTKDGMNEEMFFNAIHENRLFVDGYPDDRMVDFVMFRKDIVDHILDNQVLDMYVGDGKGTVGYGNNYIEYKFSDITNAVPGFLDRLEQELATYDDKMPPALRLKYASRGLSEIFDYKERNLVSIYLRPVTDYRFSQLVQISEEIVDLMSTGQREIAHKLLVDVLLASYINSFMESTRKLWMPAGHEGSQSNDVDSYRTLINAMNAAIDEEQKQWDDENCDDDEE